MTTEALIKTVIFASLLVTKNEKRKTKNWTFSISDGAILSNNWYHIAGSYRKANSRARLYINGRLANELILATPLKRTAVPVPNNSMQAQWKCASLGASRKEKPLQGIMDEFRIFKCELLPEEIMDLYSKNSVKRFKIPLRPRHKLLWNFLTQEHEDWMKFEGLRKYYAQKIWICRLS